MADTDEEEDENGEVGRDCLDEEEEDESAYCHTMMMMEESEDDPRVIEPSTMRRMMMMEEDEAGLWESLQALPSSAAYPSPGEAIDFLLVDLQLRTDRVQGTCVELFGRASDGASVYVTVHGWYPYLYVPAPSGWLDTQGNKDCLRIALQEALGTALESQKAQDPTLQHAQRILYQFDNAIVQMELIVATDIMGFDTTKEQQLFLKIEVISQALIAPLRRLLETEQTLGMTADGVPTLVRKTRSTGTSTTYNSNLDPILQFMVDKQLSGCQWCRAQMIASSSSSSGNGCRSRCRYEVSCHVDELHLLSSEERSDLGPLRILSFDLEAAGRRGVFPDPGIDPVIQISIHMKPQQDRPILLSFKDCDAIEGARVMSYETEEAMLLAFRDIVVSFDPDILTGYNICNFDMEYLQKRAQALGIEDEFCTMTRVCPPPANHKNKKKEDTHGGAASIMTSTTPAATATNLRKGPEHMHVREVYFQSAQVGKRKSNKVSIRGRVVLDVYLWMLNNFRLEEYKLDSVCRLYLPEGMTKEDLHFTAITPKWQAGPEGRRELGVYCLKDAELPLALIEALNIMFNAVERARVIGIPMEYVLNRGNLVRFTSQLMRKSAARGFVLPYVDALSPLRSDSSKYRGATVMEVSPGIFEHTVVLDFSSMYPSIIIAHNLCYSTMYTRGLLKGPLLRYNAHAFVDEQTRKGVIPAILEGMLKERKSANLAYQAETDPVKKAVLKAREQSIKVLNNGVYGAMGCRNALIPARAVAETTTGIGRGDIQKVKEIAEAMLTVERGYPMNAVIVGGDTDSVFVKMPVKSDDGEEKEETTLQKAIELGHALAAEVNLVMKSPKRIAFEKVFRYLLLMKKKRYAGVKYEKATDKPQIDIKGIECVRRDGCQLIRNSILSVARQLATTADVDASAQLVRNVVSSIMQDAVPVEEYAIQKVLRKNIQDCAQPMSQQELVEIRRRIESPYLDTSQTDKAMEAIPLTEAEIDEAIRRKVPLRWRIHKKLPHVLVAWKMRLKDPGNAPVLGERVKYVVTLNGKGMQISAKAEPLVDVVRAGGSLLVDRHFYLNTYRKAVDGLFAPIIEQRGGNVKRETEQMLWREMLDGRLMQRDRTHALAMAPIAQAFQPQKKRADGATASAAASPVTTTLMVNHAERTQMKEQVLKRQADAQAKKTASMEKSPLLKAFARQQQAAKGVDHSSMPKPSVP